MIFFTADTHFGHAGIIDSCKRPFGTVDAMDEALIANWNRVVAPGDEVWHLGDFAFHKDPSHYLRRLNGSVHLIMGNHDDSPKIKKAGFASVRDVHYLRIEKARFWLSHYPHRSWRSSCHGALHFHGHSHGNAGVWRNALDVGVDCHNYTPISGPKAVEIIALRGSPFDAGL